ncbi:hypothetical protein Amme_041_013 [Acidomonas methanolica NBRC 104435]|uniref:Uncharacterized protein n=1 Tax=Acidomonas methanolica NBRC 104435 TaxID=1231351 RepID=A0A023D4H5_ACIMT|nr:hypothetical protein Amme_041_013 [Acidomonas methanolica NBRC 104435]GEK97610.1 hypothetical protein AME01nite_01090 [Acidomonas methanolica NBRC 104435]
MLSAPVAAVLLPGPVGLAKATSVSALPPTARRVATVTRRKASLFSEPAGLGWPPVGADFPEAVFGAVLGAVFGPAIGRRPYQTVNGGLSKQRW